MLGVWLEDLGGWFTEGLFLFRLNDHGVLDLAFGQSNSAWPLLRLLRGLLDPGRHGSLDYSPKGLNPFDFDHVKILFLFFFWLGFVWFQFGLFGLGL